MFEKRVTKFFLIMVLIVVLLTQISAGAPIAAELDISKVSVSTFSVSRSQEMSLATNPSVFLTIDDTIVSEGTASDINIYAQFTVRLSHPLSSDFGVMYETEDWTAVRGRDYVYTDGYLLIEAGEVEGKIKVRILGDDIQGASQRSFLVNIKPSTTATSVDLLDGTAMGTILEDDLNLQRWSANYDYPANLIKLKVDSDGNSYLVNDWEVLSIGPGGTFRWATSFRGEIKDIALDKTGILYATGDNGLGDVFAAKLNSDGSLIWNVSFDSGNKNPDWGMLITLDMDGNVYILGGTEGDRDDTDQIVLKIDQDGDLVWLQRLSIENSSEASAGIGVDLEGNVYTAGVSGAGWDAVVRLASFTKDGVYRWSMTYKSFGAPQNLISDVEYDPYGNVYLALKVYESGQSRIATAKISSQGEIVWQTYSLGVLGGYDEIYDLLLDPQGGFYLAMQVDIQTRIVKYRENGYDTDWMRILEDIYFTPNRLAFDVFGNILCTGNSLGSVMVTMLFNRQNGERLWEQVLDQTLSAGVLATSGYYGREVALGPDGIIYVAGDYAGLLTMVTYNPLPEPSLVWISDNSVQEPISGTLTVYIQLKLSTALDHDLLIGYQTIEGTASADQDYLPISGTLTIPAHHLAANLGVTIQGDAVHEPREHFYLLLSPVSKNFALIDSLGTIAIWDANDKQMHLPLILR